MGRKIQIANVFT